MQQGCSVRRIMRDASSVGASKARIGSCSLIITTMAHRILAVVLRIDDSRVVTPEAPLDPAQGEFEHHCDYLGSRGTVLMRWPERHINHSCDPNTYVRTLAGQRYVFALRPIAAGEEITYDYCVNGYGDTLWDCDCGAPRCQRRIHSDFFHLPLKRQIEYLPLLDLWYVDEYREQVEALLRTQLNDGA
jgi:hypothetical protein